MRLAGRVFLLVALWLLAWGEITVANVVSGISVAAALLVAFPLGRRTGAGVRLHLVGIARLGAYVVGQLAISNVVVAREILRPSPSTRPGVLAHRLRHPSEEVITLMSSVIALSPGTMTVDVSDDSSTIYVHFLLLHDIDAARAAIARLERLAVGAVDVSPNDPAPHTRTPKGSP
jgi:multicomponent Na+:H+ antiporter subunit E